MTLSVMFTVAWLLSAVGVYQWTFRKKAGEDLQQRQISSKQTVVVTTVVILAAATISGVLGAWLTSALLHAASRTPEWYARWSFVLAPVGFLFWWVSAGQVFWNNFVSLREVAAGHAGVILAAGERLRTTHLFEGTHYLPNWFTVLPVDMRQRPSDTIVLEDVSFDSLKMNLKGVYFCRIKDPDNYLDNKKPEEALVDVFKAAARLFIRGKTKEELMLPTARTELEQKIAEEIIQYDDSLPDTLKFLDHGSISVRIDDLEPPAEILDAASKKAAEKDLQDQQMTRLNAFVERFKVFMAANPTLSEEERARMFMLQEGLTSAEEFIIRGLESTGPVGAALAAEIQRNKRGTKKSGK